MRVVRVGVVGATGYSGVVATRLLAAHPSFELAFCTSDQRAGASVGRALGVPVPAGLTYAPNAEAESLAQGVDAVILATSAAVSCRLAPAIFGGKGVAERVVVDLSGAFRLSTPEDYTQWYALEHPRPELLARAHYGLPELFGPPVRAPGEATLIANPGCYATAALLALAPLLRAGLIEERGIIVDAKSGVTGAGRQSKEEYSLAELGDDVRAYKLFSHQHTPEIARFLARAAAPSSSPGSSAGPSPSIGLTFTPHLLPVKRGILATCYARTRGVADVAALEACLARAYATSAFVDVVPPTEVTLSGVVGTNRARVGVTASDDVVIVLASIDNLLKGASGQAVQNLNLAFGLDEGAGLLALPRSSG
jgi:N-acetyl-gamma-glutamyl-phosphate reductase